MAEGIPTREEMVKMLWADAQKPDCKAHEKAKLCRVIAHLMGYNRGEDYSDLEEKLRELEIMEAQRPKQPEVPWWEQTEGEEQ
jgi:hypothetical protein